MQIIRNTKTGLEFPATDILINFAKNPRNNLVLVDVEVEVEEAKPATPATPALPLLDSPDDGFAPPPPLRS